MEIALAVASSLLSMLPIFIAWTVAVVIAVRRWEQHRNVSAWLVIGVSILFATGVFGRVIGVALPMTMSRRGTSAAQLGWVLAGWSMVSSIISAGGWAFVIAAVFGERRA
jgi:hypothetical protein